LKALCQGAKTARQAIGCVDYGRTLSERSNAIFRRFLYFVRDLAAGEEVTRDAVRSVRPGYGAAPKELDNILGKKVVRDVKANTPVDLKDIAV